jgi:small nuclear ribonucleoprotein (snRNP)-like protein
MMFMPKKNKKDFVPVYAEQSKVEQVIEPKELDDALDKKRDTSPRFSGGKNYLFEYNHKIVVVFLINGAELQGKLHVGDDNFNVQLEDVVTNNRILIPKHSLLYLFEKV